MPRDPYLSQLAIDSRRVARDFLPDGDLRKAPWRRAQWIRFDHDWAGKRHYPRSETYVASRWTRRHVYFAFSCKYSTLNLFEGEDPGREKWGLWERDVAEVFLNPEPQRVNHYYEFEVAPNNLWIDLEIDLDRKPFNDASWNSKFLHATRIGKGVWTCEMRIPVEALTAPGHEIRPGAEWRGNFFRAEGTGDNTTRRFLAWSPTCTPKPDFHVPSRFGIIRYSLLP